MNEKKAAKTKITKQAYAVLVVETAGRLDERRETSVPDLAKRGKQLVDQCLMLCDVEVA